MTNELKRTPLYGVHESSGGRFVPFGGWEMPVRYAPGIQKEHLFVRSHSGLFDVSHMGEIEIRGPQALEEVNRLMTNDLSGLSVGQAIYSPMCFPDGGIIDDLVIYRTGESKIFICCNASNREKDFSWLSEQIKQSEVVDRSDEFAQIAFQGPRAEEILQSLTQVDLKQIKRFTYQDASIAGVQMMVSRTGYTGEDGFELYLPNDDAHHTWGAICEAGGPENVMPIGLGARDTLRLEVKYCLYGQDINETTTPLEAGLGWTVKLTAGEFVGKDVLAAQKSEGVKRRLVCLVVDGRGIPRPGYEVFSDEGERLGQVTSGTMSPSVKKGIALAYVRHDFAKIGSRVSIKVREQLVNCAVVKPPFLNLA